MLYPGKWGIVIDFVLEEKQLRGKDLLIAYDQTIDVSESRDGCLIIETLKAPIVKGGDSIELTIRDRQRKKRSSAPKW